MPDYVLKCDVTQNGNGFDKPASVSIRKRPDVPSKTTLTFPNLDGQFNEYFASNDLIAVYLGLDALEPNAIVIGFPFEIAGRSVLTVGLADMMTILNRSQKKIDLRDNLDGVEAAFAIRNMIDNIDQSMYYQQVDTSRIKGTDPGVWLDSSFRYEKYGKVLTIIKDIHSRCYDTTEYPKTPLPYTFYMQENKFIFRKMQRVQEATAVIDFPNVDDLLNSSPTRSLMPVINKCTIIGGKYKDIYGNEFRYEGTYENASAIKMFGEHHAVFSDEGLMTDWECYQKAIRVVTNSYVRNITSSISVPNLFSAIPNVTVISANDSKYGISGNNLISSLDISVGGGSTKCTATLNNSNPVLIEYL